MLQDAHKGQEAMSKAASAVKDERWGDAQRALKDVQDIITTLMREVGDKAQESCWQLRRVAGAKADKPDRE